MSKLPFMISDKDWETLAPKKIEQLTQRKDLDPDQQRFLEIFRVVDLRVEWVCGRMVIVNNIMIIMLTIFLLFLVAQNSAVLSLLTKIFP